MKKWLLVITVVFMVCACVPDPVPSSNGVRTHKTERKVSKKGARKPGKRKSEGTKTTLMTGPQIFEKYKHAVFMIVVSDGYNGIQGSGFFINSSGLAVSNYHVFNSNYIGYEKIKVGNICYGVSKIVAQSQNEDWVLFTVDGGGRDFSYIPVGRKNPKVGSKVYALGSPRGLENTFSSGEISQIRSGGKILQISVPIDHGSSGGALIDEYGRVVGITSAGIDDSGANLNFAYSIQLLRNYIE